jgi:hypothetical protein
MCFRRNALLSLGGFDARFRIAGDDVDLCWRLQERGMTLGFNPAAVVWHHRRDSVRAYLKQQLNYGKAEAMLEGKWPEKYNSVGHVRWKGSLYGQGKTVPLFTRRSRIYHGAGYAAFTVPDAGVVSSDRGARDPDDLEHRLSGDLAQRLHARGDHRRFDSAGGAQRSSLCISRSRRFAWWAGCGTG